MNYTIWDNGQNYRKFSIAKKQFSLAELSRNNTIASINETQSALKTQLNLERQSFKIAKEVMDAAKEAFNILERDYREGRASYLDFLTGLRSRADAELSYFTKAIDLRKLYARFLYENSALNEKSQIN